MKNIDASYVKRQEDYCVMQKSEIEKNLVGSLVVKNIQSLQPVSIWCVMYCFLFSSPSLFQLQRSILFCVYIKFLDSFSKRLMIFFCFWWTAIFVYFAAVLCFIALLRRFSFPTQYSVGNYLWVRFKKVKFSAYFAYISHIHSGFIRDWFFSSSSYLHS